MAQRAKEGGVGWGRGEGSGRGLGAGALRRHRAASPRRPALRPLPPGRRPPPPPSPSQQHGLTALDLALANGYTEVFLILEKYDPAYLAAQVGRAAPHPPPRRTAPPRRVRPMLACIASPLAVASQHTLASYHFATVAQARRSKHRHSKFSRSK